jgi:hypothetical protein
MTESRIEAVTARLCAVSRQQYVNPYRDLVWPERLDLDQWFTSPELISLHGTAVYEALREDQQRRLSFYEAVNFFSLNIHGEKALIEGLARRLYQRDKGAIAPYLHHFLDEENKHMVYFGGFCNRYAGKIYPDRKLDVPRDYQPGEEDLLFFARVLIFEEIVDVYNVAMAADRRLAPIAREINRAHHRDEARHLVFGREIVAALLDQYRDQWAADVLRGIKEYLQTYLVATWKEYYNPDVYRDVGIEDAYTIRQRAFSSDTCVAHRVRVTERCLGYLQQHGLAERNFAL